MVQISQWLQDDIEYHAEQLVRQRIAEKHGGQAKDYFTAPDHTPAYKGEHPCRGVFHYTVYRYDGMNDFLENISISVRDVVRDYVMGE